MISICGDKYCDLPVTHTFLVFYDDFLFLYQ